MGVSAGEMMMVSEESLRFRRAAQYLRRAQAAAYIEATYGFPCSRQWLAKLAVIGGGPVYRKAGRIPIYAPEDLDAWALARIGAPRRSTSDVSVPSKGNAPVSGGRY
jgi:hypothetical protein